ncbi:hypothetical protein PV325_011234, partial [Microctonus aethiopoides]
MSKSKTNKNSQSESNMDSQTNNPVILPPVEAETASGTIPVDEVELMRRRVSALARELNPWELVTTLDAMGLNCKGPNDVLTDRLVRAELIRSHGGGVSEWDPEVDEREGAPRTLTGWQAEPSVDEIVEKVRLGLLDISRNSVETGPAPNREQNRRRELEPINQFENNQALPSGQSMGRFRDPISFSQDEEELGAQYAPTTSGYSNQAPVSGTTPTPNRGRIPTITFADGYRMASSPAMDNQRRGASSTRIAESVERRERRYQVPSQISVPSSQLPQIPEQLPQLPQNPVQFPQLPQNPEQFSQLPQNPEQFPQPPPVNNTSWFKNATFNFPGTRPMRPASRLNLFRDPGYRRISDRVAKIGKSLSERNIKFSGVVKGGGEEYLWRLTEAIRQHGLTKEETMQIIPFTLELPASGWLRAEEHRIHDFEDFIEQFRRRFSNSDCQAKLWQEIQARTQGPGEPITEYLTK